MTDAWYVTDEASLILVPTTSACTVQRTRTSFTRNARTKKTEEDGERLGELEESQLEIHFDLVTDRKKCFSKLVSGYVHTFRVTCLIFVVNEQA